MSKWVGESERLVKTLFAVAYYHTPSVVFVDEVDSLFSRRKSEEDESTSRSKAELLVQMDGVGTPAGRVIVVGATNRPHELDEAARRRFEKRLYIPLPEETGRWNLVRHLLSNNLNSVSEKEVEQVVMKTDGFSGADIKSLCQEASMGPIRDSVENLSRINESELPPISFAHFSSALRHIRPSVAQEDLELFANWNSDFGTYRREDVD